MQLAERFRSYCLPAAAVATIATAAWLGPLHRHASTAPDGVAMVPRPMDIVFVIDSTSTMAPSIVDAKATINQIANQWTAFGGDVRIGYVAYRDFGDDYITKDQPLTSAILPTLREVDQLTVAGGGDTPEDVAAGLDDALRMSWRADATRWIVLIGDAPPADRGDVARYDELARQAGARGIQIDTIRCQDDPSTEHAFREIAQLSGGTYSELPMATPVVVPEPVAPEPVAPEPVAPEPVAPEPVAPTTYVRVDVVPAMHRDPLFIDR